MLVKNASSSVSVDDQQATKQQSSSVPVDDQEEIKTPGSKVLEVDDMRDITSPSTKIGQVMCGYADCAELDDDGNNYVSMMDSHLCSECKKVHVHPDCLKLNANMCSKCTTKKVEEAMTEPKDKKNKSDSDEAKDADETAVDPRANLGDRLEKESVAASRKSGRQTGKAQANSKSSSSRPPVPLRSSPRRQTGSKSEGPPQKKRR